VATSFDHEALLELFRQRETLAVELISENLGVAIPPWSKITVSEGELGQIDPVETRADLVLLLNEAGTPVFGIVVEVQLSRVAEKRMRWPLYAVTLRAKHRCPVTVMVVTPSRSVARWARAPIVLGPGNIFSVVVLGPESIPRIDRPNASPELALLSMKVHVHSEADIDVIEATARCIKEQLSEPERSDYQDLLFAWLAPSIRERMKTMLRDHFPFPQSELGQEYFGRGRDQGREEGRQQGELRGAARVVLQLLALKFGALSPEVERRVHEASKAELEAWTPRILTAASIDEVFDAD
jgi:hypothetical protein